VGVATAGVEGAAEVEEQEEAEGHEEHAAAGSQ
jgi:hypothetical protein